ncbi:MAG TPA: cell envelope integrity EipB family protein [Stellaceae bacterium]|nr:cell envelope integrity EipB family protein [Stellaceae bacterium]
MIVPPARLVALACLLCLGAAPAARAVDIAPHRALYSLTLARTKSTGGVVAASGAMVYEWGETCDGWTVQQRFRLRLEYAEQDNVDVNSTLVSWESKDGLRYRFNERRVRNGELDEEIKGDAQLDGPGKGGTAEFTKPATVRLRLPAGTLFPTAHTLFLIERAKAGDQLVSRQVFDGATVENAAQITAVIARSLKPGASNASDTPKSPLLDRPSWRMRLAFFPADSKQEQPDYELGMRLLDNGVSQEMTLDYGDYVIHAKLDDIEALSRPSC